MTIGKPAGANRFVGVEADVGVEALRAARETERRAWDVLLPVLSSLGIPHGLPRKNGSRGLDRQAMMHELIELARVAGGDRAELGLARSLLAQVEATRWSVVRDYDPLVRVVAKKLLSKFESDVRLDDLCQLGRIGLYEALKRFDPDRGIAVGTYGRWWIRAVITRQAPVDGIPAGAREQFRTLRKFEGLGVRGDQELAETMGLTTRRVRDLRVMFQRCISLNELCDDSDSGSGTLLDALPADSDEYESSGLDFSAVMRHVGQLSDRLRFVIVMRFGLDGRGEHSLVEIGQQMGVSRERVRQMESQALALIRDRLAVPPSDTSSVVVQRRERSPAEVARLRQRVVAVVSRHPAGISANRVARITGDDRQEVGLELSRAVVAGQIRTNGLPRSKTVLYPAEGAQVTA